MATKIVKFDGLVPYTVKVLPMLSDNYSYLLTCHKSKKCLAIDPVDPKILFDNLEDDHQLIAIGSTHHHDDHTGGNIYIAEKLKGIRIYGYDNRIPGISHFLKDGESFQIGEIKIQALHTPCHTTGSLCFFIHSDNPLIPSAVFTGDTLFTAGCGRFFEGDAKQMKFALLEKLGSLPKNTKTFVGHEYTKSNINFAKFIEPHNKSLLELEEKLKNTKISVPGTIGEEFNINPFMRLEEKAILEKTKKSDPVDVMRELRKIKNEF